MEKWKIARKCQYPGSCLLMLIEKIKISNFLGTIRSRQLHFLIWICSLHLGH